MVWVSVKVRILLLLDCQDIEGLGIFSGRGAKQINKVSPTKTSHNIPLLSCCLNDYVRLAYVLLAAIFESKHFPGCHKKLTQPLNGNLIRPQPDQALSSMRIPHFDCFSFKIVTSGIYSSLNSQSSPL